MIANRCNAGWHALLVVVAMGCGPASVDNPEDPDAAARADARPSGQNPDASSLADARPSGPVPDARGPNDVCESTDPGSRTAPAFGAPTVTTSGLLVRVMNNCPFPLWIHGEGGDGGTGRNVLAPDDVRLGPGESRDYDGKQTFSSARVTAFRAGPRQNEAQFVEMHYAAGTLGYNISYVDYLGLPVEVDAACGTTACYAAAATIHDGCPAHLDGGDRCHAPAGFCNANRSHPYCTALDAKATAALALPRCRDDLNRWLSSGGSRDRIGTTPAVYACSEFWSSSAFCCAIVNRGVVDTGDPADVCTFYDADPHNTYARWVHERCPKIYAFPYDDSGDQGGFLQCPTREMRITWCPGG